MTAECDVERMHSTTREAARELAVAPRSAAIWHGNDFGKDSIQQKEDFGSLIYNMSSTLMTASQSTSRVEAVFSVELSGGLYSKTQPDNSTLMASSLQAFGAGSMQEVDFEAVIRFKVMLFLFAFNLLCIVV